MDRQEWIGKKIALLKKQGKSNQESLIIALAAWENMPKAQGGGAVTDMYGNISYPNYKPMQDGNTNDGVNIDLSDNSSGMLRPDLMPSQQQLATNKYYNTAMNNYTTGEDQEGNAINTGERKIVDNRESQIFNPYGGLDLEGSLFYSGQGFANGNGEQAAMGTGLSLLKGARNFLTGFSSAKATKEAVDSAREAQFRKNTTPIYKQEGGYSNVNNANFSNYTKIDYADGSSDVIKPRHGTFNGFDPNQKPIKDIRYNVSTTGLREGSLPDTQHYTRVEYNDGTYDYIKPEAEIENRFKRMPNYINYVKKLGMQNNPPSVNKSITFVPNTQPVMQEGGQAPQDQMQQIMQMIMQSLQQGMSPEQVIQQLVQAGVPQEQAQMLLQEVIAQSQAPQEQQQIPPQEQGQMMQEGGTATNADMMTGAYIAEDAPQDANIEIEKGEYVFNSQTGEIKKGEGERHTNGGIKVDLPEGSMILSNYTKVGAKTAKEMSSKFDIKANATDTFSQVMDKVNRKIGYFKLLDEEKEQIKKVEKTDKLETNKATQDLNAYFLGKQLQEIDKKKQDLLKEQQMHFQELFAEQESRQKQGNGQEILKEEGGSIYNPAVLEMAKKYSIHPDRVSQIMQEGGYYDLPLAQEGVTTDRRKPFYDFSTKYTPQVKGYDVQGQSILNEDNLKGVEQFQAYKEGVGYGNKMQDAERTTDLHSWYFDTPEKKQKFIEATRKKGNQPEVLAFQKAYNTEIKKRAEEVGVDSKEVDGLVGKLGFTKEGVQKEDGLFGAFTSTRPLVNFKKSPNQEIIIEETPVTPTDNTITLEGTKLMPPPLLPQDITLPPSALQNIYKGEIRFGEIDPTKISPEPSLVEAERQRQSVANNSYFLNDTQRAAVLASSLGQTQMASNDAIGKAEMFNAQQQQSADQFNLQNQMKEDLTNQELNMSFEKRNLAGQAMYENNLRSYFNELNNQNRANFNYIDRRNILNQSTDNYKNDGSNIGFYSDGTQIQNNRRPTEGLTAKQTEIYDKEYAIQMAKNAAKRTAKK